MGQVTILVLLRAEQLSVTMGFTGDVGALIQHRYEFYVNILVFHKARSIRYPVLHNTQEMKAKFENDTFLTTHVRFFFV